MSKTDIECDRDVFVASVNIHRAFLKSLSDETFNMLVALIAEEIDRREKEAKT